MANPLGSPQYLRKEPAKWNHLPTKAIRIPEVFADRLLAIASKVEILTAALDLKADAGEAIQAEIRKALKLIEEQINDWQF